MDTSGKFYFGGWKIFDSKIYRLKVFLVNIDYFKVVYELFNDLECW